MLAERRKWAEEVPEKLHNIEPLLDSESVLKTCFLKIYLFFNNYFNIEDDNFFQILSYTLFNIYIYMVIDIINNIILLMDFKTDRFWRVFMYCTVFPRFLTNISYWSVY